jgi:hypothetical protein
MIDFFRNETKIGMVSVIRLLANFIIHSCFDVVFHFSYTCVAVPMKLLDCLACDECFDQVMTYILIWNKYSFVRICKQGVQQVVFITLIQFFWYNFYNTCLYYFIDRRFMFSTTFTWIWAFLSILIPIELFEVFSSLSKYEICVFQ